MVDADVELAKSALVRAIAAVNDSAHKCAKLGLQIQGEVIYANEVAPEYHGPPIMHLRASIVPVSNK